MADKKISALTGAALPLAGTEVLPIVQSGSTVKVASNDLTTRNFRAAATTGILQVSGPTAGVTRTMTVPDANFSAARTDAGQSFSGTNGFSDVTIFSGSGNPLQVGAPPASRCIATFSDGTYNARIAASPPEGYIFVGAGSNHPVGLIVNNNVSATFDTSGNTKLENGNLVIGTAGKGIVDSTSAVTLNFSSTAVTLNSPLAQTGAINVITNDFTGHINGAFALNNTATIANLANGFIEIAENAFGACALIMVGTGATTIISQSSFLLFSTTAGNPGTVNVYKSGANVIIENKNAATLTIVTSIRKLG